MDRLSFGPLVGTVMQTSFVVGDIEREMENMTRTLGVGPFFYIQHFPLLEAEYRGNPISVDLDVALTFSGTMCLELVRQNDDKPSPFRELVARRGFGFHHFALSTRNFESALAEHESKGASVVASATVALGGRMAYLDGASQVGGLLEIIEFTPQVEEIFAMVHGAAQNWDGREPVRKFG
jgi:hypothetical protein